ncbi:MAG: PQQ-binding-like beta-propeller repeat protein [Gammaproteobacteria bacterium]|nr:PQQ-binding-like beta-propeller repeat protein [Gammaproteobacteria bacterium]MCY3688925.1 PQQ-binding-like beta-propeller repeat protein [Gammaproteobacteria bacterium]
MFQRHWTRSAILISCIAAAPALAQSDGGNPDLLADMRPVTAEMLANPGAGDWLIWRKTYDSLGYSPLDQINTENVDQLAEAWRIPLGQGSSMATPLVHDGVMFLADTNDAVLALDASSGEELWRYEHATGPDATAGLNGKFGIAIYRETIIVPTLDLRLLALDFRTGEPVWEHAIAVTADSPNRYSLRAAPLLADGVVVQGVTATMVPEGGFVVGIDAGSGEELWRFQTVAGPDDPGGHTWNDIAGTERQGGSVWVSGSYDPELDLVYFGPAPTYHTAPLLDSVDIQGVSNDALYTNSTIALRPQSGELAWHFQHVANDQWDLDWSYERQIIEVDVNGSPRKAVITAGKMALYDALDAATGEYLFSIDLGLQNLVASIDPQTGVKTMNPNARPNAESAVLICPQPIGGRNWLAASVNPESNMLFLPLAETCMMGGPTGGDSQLLSTGAAIMGVAPPDSDGNIGRLQAINLETQELAWSFREFMPPSSAVLATGGGLVFGGAVDQSFKAFDQADGAVLWSTDLGDIAASFPISYSVDGKQHIALVIGQAGLHASALIGHAMQNSGGDMSRFSGLTREGPALVVFALP